MNKLATILLLAALFFSCVDDERTPDYVKPVLPVATDKNVVLTMQIPGAYTPVTYAYSESDENEIRTVDVLVFRVDSEGNEFYYRHIPVPFIDQDNGNTKKIQFRLNLVDSRLIVLANVRDLFTMEMKDQLLTDSAMGNVSKEKMMKRFVFNMSEPFGSRREAFPMYGESDILRSSDDTVNDMKMIRSVTRIDIVNGMLDDKITIDSVYLFNAKNKGFVAPGFDARGLIVGTPNVPAEAKPNTGVFGYAFAQNAGTVSPAMEREIYVTEDGQDTDSPTAVVLKITRNGDSQFYRADMCSKDGGIMPILRNYRYRLNITNIVGNGYPTAEMAVAVLKPSLSSEVETNELGISDIVFNDHYKLGVSAKDLFFKADGSPEGQATRDALYSLKVFTTYSGWSATLEGNDLNEWLDFADAGSDGRVEFPASNLELRIKITTNATGKQRSGKIKLTAGTLSLEVNVTQYS
ncbi:MAG: BACON domain-containing protein [Tannerellaceae bacterium]|jgi:hypothetical protein|nr:BACON domain-containing protein [Tannerellaceae bacterium]